MSLSQNHINSFTSTIATAKTNSINLVNAIAVGDCLAYYNNKDNMFYFIKVVSTNVTDQETSITATGCRFSIDGATIVDIFNACANGKADAFHDVSIQDNINKAEFFVKKTVSISSLLYNGSVNSTDDITEFYVLPGPIQSGTGLINSWYSATPTGCIINSDGNVDTYNYVFHGIMRQLAHNFQYNVN